MASLLRTKSIRPWLCWTGFLAFFIALLFPSIGTSPVVWEDEVQFVDWGRVMLNPHTDWAVTWSTHDHQPLRPISYLGCMGEDLAFEGTGTVVGSRLFCIAGGLLMGSLVFAFMRGRGRPSLVDGLFAALIVLDPGLFQSYSAGRLDVMAMAFVLAGAFCIELYTKRQDWRWLAAAALVLGCAPFIWVRALMALPAALLPLVFAVELPDRRLIRALLGLAASWTFVFGLLLMPAWKGIMQTRELADSAVYLFRDLAGNGGLEGFAVIPQMLDDMLRCNLPAIPLLLFAAFGLARIFQGKRLNGLRKSLVLVALGATLICQVKLTTGLHHYTAMYLVPVLAMLALYGKERFVPVEATSRPSRWLVAIMSLLVIFHLGNIADRSYAAMLDKNSFGPDALEPTVKALPVTNRRLIVDDFRLYFLLRSHGFQPFYLFSDLDKSKLEFRSYTPPANSGYQPFYLLARTQKKGDGEWFYPGTVPALLVGGKPSTWAYWAGTFEPQLKRSQVTQLPHGYRLLAPIPP
ncbi:MAG: hypothetical protein JWO94_1457 [Verrucomicrobiaceae bacterium]|nr:hypothetical protein [Verrucomicrobiaceae bacterium]